MPAIVTHIKKWYETSSKKQKLSASLLAFSLIATGLLFAAGGGSSTSTDPLGSTPLYFAGAFFKLLIVLLLIVGSSIILRRWQQSGPSGKSIRQMRLLETVRLSPKQALHLVVIGDQKLLIGATDQNVSLISSIEYSINSAPIEEAPVQPGLDFGALLQSFNLNLSTESIKGKE
jgi:flagellar biosynthetic protein FliO